MKRRLVVALGLLAFVVAGCGESAATSASVPPSASGLASPATATAAPSGTSQPTESAEATVSASPSSAAFALSSPAFAPGAAIPRKYGCDGQGVSPPLGWTGVPDRAVELELLVDDPDANGFVHWVAAGIPPTAEGLAEGASGTNAVPVEGRNSFGKTGWGGPCPPSGTHHYRFRLYAVSRSLGLRDGVSADELRRAIRDVALGTAELIGTYSRA